MPQKLVEKHILKTYQCDRYGLIRPVMLMNELQGIADHSAEEMGGGRTYCDKNGIAWVVTHYLVDIIESPRANEELTFSTWSSGCGDVRAIRDYTIHGSDGRLMVRATSQWVLIDIKSRKPLRLNDSLCEWGYVSERAWEREFVKFEDFKTESVKTFKCRYDDIDVNQHINNAVYVAWATESVGFEYRNTHKLRGVEINFIHEIPFDSPKIDVEVKIEPHETRHKIKTGNTEHARVICYWD